MAVDSPSLLTSSADDTTERASPVATYRLQLRPEFGFLAAAAEVPYLAALGISDVYLSPVFAARAGSEHGYDISDHNQLNPELGGAEGFDVLEDALRLHHLGALLDIVPNHMGLDPSTNRWWRDVLENGPSSPYSAFFDVDWDPLKPELENRVLLPILGDQYGAVLERGELRVALVDGGFELRYFDHRLPLNPRQLPLVLDADALRTSLGGEHPETLEFLSILTALKNLPPYVTRDLEQVAERQRESKVARARLAHLLGVSPAVRAHVERCLERLNGTVGEPRTFAALHDLLERQAYRLAYWRTAFDEINYRRFFDVNELAGLRTEHPHVFDETHALVRRLAARGVVRGVRVDHPDGLYDPRRYFERLAAALREPGDGSGVTGTSGPAVARPACQYVLAEKILVGEERLPADWPVAGTTGYPFLVATNGLFVDPDGLATLRRAWARVTGIRQSFDEMAYACKKLIMLTTLASELNVLAHAMNRLSERSWRTRDFTLNSCRKALLEFVACLPVYRTYRSEVGISDTDRAAIERALQSARRRNPATEHTIYDFLRDLLIPVAGQPAAVDGATGEECLAFAMKLQQYSGPVHAKGLEDTAFYRYNVLTSLNEVGGDPAHGTTTPGAWHGANARRLREWPLEMIATSTHDTKRGEDHRARVNVLSEFPDEWRAAVAEWTRLHAGHRVLVDGSPAPSRNDEYLLYQALLGVWPMDAPPGEVPADLPSRAGTFMLKAIREGKVHSSWINPNQPYEAAVATFVARVLGSSSTPRFLATLEHLLRDVAVTGMVNALAQLTLKIASPGVPDFYQGSDAWDLSLVDPDNRRAVDFKARRAMLEGVRPLLEATRGARGLLPGTTLVEPVTQLVAAWPDGRLKLYVTAQGLALRRGHPDLFLRGDYEPLDADDVGAGHVIALRRRHRGTELLAVVPRLTRRLRPAGQALPLGASVWGTARIPLPAEGASAQYLSLLTGERIAARKVGGTDALFVAEVLRHCPVALLWRLAS